jgi:hypothetical protein
LEAKDQEERMSLRTFAALCLEDHDAGCGTQTPFELAMARSAMSPKAVAVKDEVLRKEISGVDVR